MIQFDSRKVQKGDTFVAVKGYTVDGHDYIQQAIKKGATLVYGEKDLNYDQYIKVKDSRKKLGELASEFYGNPSRKLKVVGVTGTKGKTTTSYLIYHILKSLGAKVGLVTSIGAKIGEKEMNTGFHVTNPDVVSLNSFLKEMVDQNCEYAVLEVSSHGIDQGRISGIEFEVGVLTNIAPEHLDYHKTFKEYKRVKMSFIKNCKKRVIGNKKTDLKVLEGDFNNFNAETAIKTVFKLGFKNRKQIIDTLKSFSLPKGRLEEVETKMGFKVFIDFAHTPDSFEAVLGYLRKITKGNLISVFGSAGERDNLKRPKMGKIAAKLSDEIVLTAEDPRSENVNDIISDIKSGIPKSYTKIHEIIDRKEAILFALGLAKKSDTIAVLGKGHETSMNLDGVNEIPWSDREVIEKHLEKVKHE